MNNGVTLLSEFRSNVEMSMEVYKITYNDVKENISYIIHLIDKIPDYRRKYLVDYSLTDLILLSILLIMKGEFKSFHYAAEYLDIYRQEYTEMGLIHDNKIPSHDTLRRMFMLLDAQYIKEEIIDNLGKCLKGITENIEKEKKPELMSVDGKEFRGSGRGIHTQKPMENKDVLNVYNTSQEICIFSQPLDSKGDERKEAQIILNKLNLKNKIVTGDALHCLRETCEIIIKRKGDYVFTVKENQGLLLEEIMTRMKEKKKIRKITFNDCEYYIYPLSPTYQGLEFQGQKSYVWMISNKRKKQPTKKKTERHFITSLSNDRLIAEVIDNRWKIENDLHKIKDEMFNEDDYTFTNKNAIKVMALFNNIAYSFFRVVAALLPDKSQQQIKIIFKKDPYEVLSKISSILETKDFSKLLRNNLKGKKAK